MNASFLLFCQTAVGFSLFNKNYIKIFKIRALVINNSRISNERIDRLIRFIPTIACC